MRLHGLRQGESEQDDEGARDRHGDLPGHLVGVTGRLEEEERAEDETRAARERKRAVTHHERLGAEEGGSEQQ